MQWLKILRQIQFGTATSKVIFLIWILPLVSTASFHNQLFNASKNNLNKSIYARIPLNTILYWHGQKNHHNYGLTLSTNSKLYGCFHPQPITIYPNIILKIHPWKWSHRIHNKLYTVGKQQFKYLFFLLHYWTSPVYCMLAQKQAVSNQR